MQEFLPQEQLALIDLDSIKIEKTSFVEDHLKENISDIIYSFNCKRTETDNNTEPNKAFVLTILEHQSTSDYWTAFRLWKYSFLLIEKYITKEKKKLPPVIPLVLYNGRSKYTAPLNLWELFSHPEFVKQIFINNYNLLDLQSIDDDDIDYEKHMSFLLYVMKHIHQRDAIKMLDNAFKKCAKAIIIDKGKDYLLTKLIFWYTNDKVPAEKKELFEQVIIDNLSIEDADTYREEGIEIGEARGETKGVEKAAIAMLKENSDPKFVASVTGFSFDHIAKLKASL